MYRSYEENFIADLYTWHKRVCDCAFTASQHRCELHGFISAVRQHISDLVIEIEQLEEKLEKFESRPRDARGRFVAQAELDKAEKAVASQ